MNFKNDIVLTNQEFDKKSKIIIGLITISFCFIYIPAPKLIMTLFSLFLLIFSITSMNKVTRGFALIYLTAPVLGTLFYVFHIPITAYFLCVLFGAYYLYPYVRFRRKDLNIFAQILLLMLVFIISFLYGPQHSYSNSKLINIIILGCISFFYWDIYKSSQDIEINKLAIYMVIVPLTYIFIAFDFLNFPHPDGISDFDFMRNSFVLMIREGELVSFTYHSIGVNAMIGGAFLLSKRNFNKTIKGAKWEILLLVIIFMTILISQARQALFGLLIILIFRILIDNGINRSTKIINIIVFGLIASLFLLNIESSALNQMEESSSFTQSINRDYSDAFRIIDTNPILGKGLGGYSNNGMRAYPHNIFLELLCEVGMIGTLFILLIVCLPLSMNYRYLPVFTKSNYYILPIIITIFIRSNMSSDLTESINLLTCSIVLLNRNN